MFYIDVKFQYVCVHIPVMVTSDMFITKKKLDSQRHFVDISQGGPGIQGLPRKLGKYMDSKIKMESKKGD